MGQAWFTNEDSGTLDVVQRDGKWYVHDSEVSGDTVCLFSSGGPPAADGVVTVDVRIQNFRRGTGDAKNYLSIETVENGGQGSASEGTTSSGESAATDGASEPGEQATKSGRGHPERSLFQFVGTGDYVTVEARIKEIEYVKMDRSDMPDMKGVLAEEGSTKKMPFVVSDGAGHPYLEEKQQFRFEGVKDHKYEKKNEVQVLMTEHTQYTKLE